MLTTREMYTLPGADHASFPVRREIAALVLAVAPLFVHISMSTNLNGRVTGYTDLADILLGIALIIATLGNRRSLAVADARYTPLRMIFLVLLLVTAVVHIASGSGLFAR